VNASCTGKASGVRSWEHALESSGDCGRRMVIGDVCDFWKVVTYL